MKTLLRLLRLPLLLLLGLIAVGGAVIALNPGWIKIGAIEIDQASASKQDLLYQRIKASLTPQFGHFEGRYFWQVPLSDLFDIASRDRRVKKVSIYREFPSRLRIEIEPYTPVMAYLARDGRIYLLPAVAAADAPDLPFLRGDDFKDESDLREKALELYKSIPDQGELSKARVSEILYSKKDGFKVFVAGLTGEIRLGDTDFGPKVSRVQKVLSYLDSQNIKGRVIDARFSKKVVVRVRNTP
jgi:cell division septal protein FtsQ